MHSSYSRLISGTFLSIEHFFPDIKWVLVVSIQLYIIYDLCLYIFERIIPYRPGGGVATLTARNILVSDRYSDYPILDILMMLLPDVTIICSPWSVYYGR